MPFDIDLSGLESFVYGLATAVGHGSNTERALYAVGGKIIDTAISYTPMSTEAKLVERVNADVSHDFARYDSIYGDGVLTTNLGSRGGLPAGTQWMRETSTRTGQPTFYIMRGGNPRRWSAQRWARYQATAAQRETDLAQSLRVRTQRAKESIGLTRQSWVQIADDLGIALASDAEKYRAAVAGNGIAYKNGTGTRQDGEDGLVLVFENSMPGLIRQGGAAILRRAVETRRTAMETELRKGVFDDLDTLAKRYPALVTVT